MTARVCSMPGCRGLAVPGSYRCAEHRPTAMAAYNRHRRATTFQLYDTAAWRKLRRSFLAAHPWCAVCGAKATDVDHRVPRPRGAPLDRNQWDADANLSSLCSRCHKSKTRRETNERLRRQHV
jgi:5-methylcytosine-specific restriction protein A